MQLADICRKYEHEGDDLQYDTNNDVDTLDYENLSSSMVVSFKCRAHHNKLVTVTLL